MYYVGTSGWSYDHWKNIFYPKGVTGSGRLPLYAQHFNTVEINVTFYRFPTDVMLAAWNKQLPCSFRLSIKGSRRITHRKTPPEQATIDAFLTRVSRLRHAAVVLWQMPPFRSYEPAYLEHFLATACKTQQFSGLRCAIEFRHPSWWCPETYALLGANNVAFVNLSDPRFPGGIFDTADLCYVRFHGLDTQTKYQYDYSNCQLLPWISDTLGLATDKDVYVYFNNDIEGHAIANAKTFKLLSELRYHVAEGYLMTRSKTFLYDYLRGKKCQTL